MIALRLSMQGKDIIKDTIASAMCLQFGMTREVLLSILKPSVSCVHFSQLINHLYHMHTPHNSIDHTDAKI